MGSSYQILSEDEVDALHRAFIEGIKSKAPKFVPDDAANNAQVLSDIIKNLLIAARQRIKLTASDLALLGQLDLTPAENVRKDWLRYKLKGSYFSPEQQASFAKAEAARKDDPVIEKVFGGKKRIYLKCDVDAISETRRKVAHALMFKGYTITSYKEGYATDASRRQTYRIGKLLKDDEDLRRLFENDPVRAGDTLIVISRDAMDIARMSTNRGWSSCQAADGDFSHYLPMQIRDGALVAYLISSRDPEINDPLARITIKSYRSLEELSAMQKAQAKMDQALNIARLRSGEEDSVRTERAQRKFILLKAKFDRFAARLEKTKTEPNNAYAAGKMYGIGHISFRQVVQEFIEERLNKGKFGTFELRHGMYNDYDLPQLNRTGKRPLRPAT